MTMRNAFDDLATEGSVSILKAIFRLLKPLGVPSGNGSNRLSVDVNNVSGGTVTVAQATAANLNATVTGTVTANPNLVGGVSAFDLMKAMSRTAYNSGVRSNLS